MEVAGWKIASNTGLKDGNRSVNGPGAKPENREIGKSRTDRTHILRHP